MVRRTKWDARDYCNQLNASRDAFNGGGKSMTGEFGLPVRTQETKLESISRSVSRCVLVVWVAQWGRRDARSDSRRYGSIEGSYSKTSNPTRETLFDFMARTRAFSSMTGNKEARKYVSTAGDGEKAMITRADHVPAPRAVFMINTPSFMRENSASESMWRVSLDSGQCREITSAVSMSSSNETYSAEPSSVEKVNG